MNDSLMVSVMGFRNSGKSTTWNALFGRIVRTGGEQRRLALSPTEFVEVFLVSGSPEERHKYVGDIIGKNRPRIDLCSMQYRSDVTQTIDYFLQNQYSIYTQWLNPGFSDASPQPDSLSLLPYLLDRGAIVSIRDGKAPVESRVRELRDFIYGWAHSRGLIRS